MKNNTTPLDELRKEKAILKAECNEREESLSEYWAYINDNIGYLLLDGVISTFKRKLGLAPSPKKEQQKIDDEQDESSSGIGNMMQTIKTGLQMMYPLVWEIVQPFVWDFVIGKIKSFFIPKRKKKKKKLKDAEDED